MTISKGKDPSEPNEKSETEMAVDVLRKMARRALYDPDFCEELKKDQIGLMRAAGMSMVALARIQGRVDLPDDELQQYLIALDEADDAGPSALRVTNTCIRTCRRQTLWVCGGCERSFKAAEGPTG